MLYFAYGSNLSRSGMRQRAPGARAIGVAVLEGHRFVIGRDGWASVEPARGQCVYGVLWKITPRGGRWLRGGLPLRFGDAELSPRSLAVGTYRG